MIVVDNDHEGVDDGKNLITIGIIIMIIMIIVIVMSRDMGLRL